MAVPVTPTPPSILERSARTLKLSWVTDPAVTIYILKIKDYLGNEILRETDQSQIVITELVPNSRYEFSLQAQNEEGRSLASSITVAWTMLPTPSSAPLLFLSPSDGSITIGWDLTGELSNIPNLEGLNIIVLRSVSLNQYPLQVFVSLEQKGVHIDYSAPLGNNYYFIQVKIFNEEVNGGFNVSEIGQASIIFHTITPPINHFSPSLIFSPRTFSSNFITKFAMGDAVTDGNGGWQENRGEGRGFSNQDNIGEGRIGGGNDNGNSISPTPTPTPTPAPNQRIQPVSNSRNQQTIRAPQVSPAPKPGKLADAHRNPPMTTKNGYEEIYSGDPEFSQIVEIDPPTGGGRSNDNQSGKPSGTRKPENDKPAPQRKPPEQSHQDQPENNQTQDEMHQEVPVPQTPEIPKPTTERHVRDNFGEDRANTLNSSNRNSNGGQPQQTNGNAGNSNINSDAIQPSMSPIDFLSIGRSIYSIGRGIFSVAKSGSRVYVRGTGYASSKHYSPKTPVYSRGTSTYDKSKHVRGVNTPTTIGGRKYTGHALDEMQSEGITPSVVENVLRSGIPQAGKNPGTTAYYDPINNITVITNKLGDVVTVSSGRVKQ